MLSRFSKAYRAIWQSTYHDKEPEVVSIVELFKV